MLGCDGANSTVRELIGATMRDLGRPDRWLVLDVRAPAPLPVWPGVHQVCDPRRPATFMPVTGDRYRWECRLAPGETVGDLTTPDAPGPAARARSTPAAVEIERAVEYTYRAQVADRWRAGRVLLAGDAAHLTPPFVGQGLGLGLRDVHQLAWKLADVLGGAPATTLLDTYQAEREPHARALIRHRAAARPADDRRRAGPASVRAPGRAGRPSAASPPSPGWPPTAARRRCAGGPLVDRRGRAGRRLAGHLLPAAGGAGRRAAVPAGRRARPGGGRAADWTATGWWCAARTARSRDLDDPSGALVRWLRHGRASAVTVRPDRIVRSARPDRVLP